MILGLLSFSIVSAYGGGGGGSFIKKIDTKNSEKISVLNIKMFNGTVLTADCKNETLILSNGRKVSGIECSKFNATKYSSYGEGYLTLYLKKKEIKSEPSVFVKVEPIVNVTVKENLTQPILQNISEKQEVVTEKAVHTSTFLQKLGYLFSFRWLWDWS